ncbi:MAG: VTT domain-containing protein [Hyphomicrobiales bacterium]|nr:VTT domain-containing protein [Hyphomicrobiales bacterium]
MTFLADKRLWIVLALVAAVLGLRLAGLGDLVSVETLRLHRATLTGYVEQHAVLAALMFAAVYAVAVALSLPGATVLTLAGGFLFGPLLGTVLNVLGATTGAVLVFVFARALFGGNVLDRFGDRAVRLGANIKANAWSYLLVLRLAPLFPFFLVNLVPAFVGVKLPVFAATTLLGIIPGTAVFTTAGAGLGRILDAGGSLHVASVLTPEVLAGLFGLAALSLAAIPLKKRFGG